MIFTSFSEKTFDRSKGVTYELNDDDRLEVDQQYGVQLQAISPSNKESPFTDMIFGTPVTNGKAVYVLPSVNI